MEAVIQPGNERQVHHILVYECYGKGGSSTSEIYEKHVGKEAVECYTPQMPPEYLDCMTHYASGWVN